MIKGKHEIKSFEWTNIVDTLETKKIATVKKRKRKGRGVESKHNTVICTITYFDDKRNLLRLPIYCCINGHIIEKNENISQKSLFENRKETYFVIIQPHGSTEKEIANSLFLKKSINN